MAKVTRTITYPDGTVEEQVIDLDKKEPSKKRVSKTDGVKRKPTEKREPVRKTYSTTSES